jgi:5-methylcytosine-specific restriction enzyme subunit McrC
LMDRPGSASASAFLVDMNDVFQRFITDRLRRAMARNTRVSSEPHYWLGVGSVVDMYPDLVFERNGRPVYVADVKYKLTRTGKGSSGDYYQLLAYTTGMDLSEGVLIYAQVDGDVPPRRVRVRNSGQLLHSYALDLSGPSNAVERGIVNLAEWITSGCERAVQSSERPLVNTSL